jgi:lipopolysaccharide heptosyltransferase II
MIYMQKILVLALSGIGDALMFTPSIKLLKQNGNYEIDALVMYKGVKDIYERNTNISNVFYKNFLDEGFIKSVLYILKLRGKYDISINIYPSNRKEYNIINLLIGARKRAGVKYLRQNNKNLGFLNNIIFSENDALHNVEENVKLCEVITNKKYYEIPPLEFPLLKEDDDYAAKYLNEINLRADELVIGFHPGCAILKNHIRRRWEPEKFSELGNRLIEELNAKILIFGGSEEDELKETVAAKINSGNIFIIKTKNLAQSTAIMKRCNLFITNDSSLMHIASALNLKVIAIIGPTNPTYIHPWKGKHKIVTLNLDCAPCFFYSPKPLTCYRKDVQFKCIKELNVDMVYKAAKDLL